MTFKWDELELKSIARTRLLYDEGTARYEKAFKYLDDGDLEGAYGSFAMGRNYLRGADDEFSFLNKLVEGRKKDRIGALYESPIPDPKSKLYEIRKFLIDAKCRIEYALFYVDVKNEIMAADYLAKITADCFWLEQTIRRLG
jgi:hypothetical protein